MKNIHLTPTDKPSRLAYYQESTSYNKPILQLVNTTSSDYKYQNIYITNSEEIKEGLNQWYLDKFLNKPRNSSGSQYGENQNVILLTTDQELDGVQAIDDEFLNWFVQNPSCEKVEVYELHGKLYAEPIITKEEPTISEKAKQRAANYMSLKGSLEPKQVDIDWSKFPKSTQEKVGYVEPKQELKIGDNTNFGVITDIKEFSVCVGKNSKGVDSWYKKSSVKLISKQESLEEAAENHWKMQYVMALDEMTKPYIIQDFIEGAKWMQEIILQLLKDNDYQNEPVFEFLEEQFKK